VCSVEYNLHFTFYEGRGEERGPVSFGGGRGGRDAQLTYNKPIIPKKSTE
jgi:hypothetical protein